MNDTLVEESGVTSNCFGCSEQNDIGLKLVFDDGVDEVSARVSLDRQYESYPGIVHGGIVSTVLDEAMGRAIMVFTGKMAVTMGLRVRFISICESFAEYRVEGKIVSITGSMIKAEARLLTQTGDLVALGEASWIVIEPEDVFSGQTKVPHRTLLYINHEVSREGAICERN
ncbi:MULTISPECIES: PaaI family thioesterase [unclassified Pseudomonas]|uniref:PaaI family thioesterase n=1 Tax=unclassified Pseudomonas TaxID=196821 RepID=UPI0030DAD499